MNYQKMRETFQAWIEDNYKLKVLWDPMPVSIAEPHVRLTFMGAEEMGAEQIDLKFALSIVGAGDGPDVFLDQLISTSIKVQNMFNKCLNSVEYVDLETDEGEKFRVTYEGGTSGAGQFAQNEEYLTERKQWNYVYTEPHYIIFDFKQSLGD